MSDSTPAAAQPSRDFTVAVFVADQGCVLLHWHRKLARWLPPGGHIEPAELPDDAAVREVAEETNQTVRLLGDRGLSLTDPGLPRQLTQPIGIQLEDIGPGHQHIDLIYVAELVTPGQAAPLPEQAGWYGPDDWPALGLTAEVTAWCERAIAFGSRG